MSIDDRIEALMAHPLSLRSMNRAGMGAVGTLCDISIEPGWVAIIEQLFARLDDLPEDQRPVITQIKEKFGSLRIYADHDSSAAKAAISFAEGQAARTCQICGCRGAHHIRNGWHATLCAAHAAGADEDAPGEDVPLAHWVLHASSCWYDGHEAADGFDKAIPAKQYTRLEMVNLATGKGPSWEFEADQPIRQVGYLAGCIEPEALVIALDPVAVIDALCGAPLPFVIQSATPVLTEMAIKAGRNLTEFSCRLEIAAAGADDEGITANALSTTWRWLNGLPAHAKGPRGAR